MIIVNVALNIFSMQTFYYKSLNKESNPKNGTRVLVPFKDKIVLGIVLSVSNKIKINNVKLEKIEKILDTEPIFSKNFLSFLIWSSKYYFYPIGKILFYILPIFLKNKNTFFIFQKWQITQKGKNFIFQNIKKKKNKEKSLFLFQKKIFLFQINKNKKNFKMLNFLKKKKYIQFNLNKKKKIYIKKNFYTNKKIEINPKQKQIINKINSKNNFVVWLLTGKSKTNIKKIYAKLIENILKKKKQILILVPEINFISEFFIYFKKYFSVIIEIIHSKIKKDEKFFIWSYIKTGYISIILGTRSSLFNDFKNLGLIIVEEEHSNYYKEENKWPYHAKNLAISRAKIENIPIILSSKTPSAESIYNIQKKKYFLIDLDNEKKKIIKQNLIHLKKENSKNSISKKLIEKIKEHLIKNHKIILILNQNNNNSLNIICYKCNKLVKCTRCNQAYSFCEKKNELYCHSCKQKKNFNKKCLSCNSININSIGLNTKKTEWIINKIFPNVNTIRFDKNNLQKINKARKKLKSKKFKSKYIIISNQIISKIQFISKINLIAILNVDSTLFSNNYQSTEKFAQFYFQIKNKFKKTKNMEIILQTYYPNNPLFSILFQEKYLNIAKKILKERKESSLPPYRKYVIFRSESYKDKTALNFLKKIKKNIKKNRKIYLMHPCRENKKKKCGLFRWKLIIQHKSIFLLRKCLKKIFLKNLKKSESKKVKWKIDIDPIDL